MRDREKSRTLLSRDQKKALLTLNLSVLNLVFSVPPFVLSSYQVSYTSSIWSAWLLAVLTVIAEKLYLSKVRLCERTGASTVTIHS